MTLADSQRSDLVALYDRLAASYDTLHHRWLKFAGGEAQSALEAAVRAVVRPNDKLLDVGCGTGAFARRLLADGLLPENLTLVEPSSQMLQRCADIPCFKVDGRLESLPFADAAFDVVTCAWAIETVADPALAVAELCRMTRDGGMLCLAFCADRPSRGLADWVIKQRLIWRETGKFLSVPEVSCHIKASGDFDVQNVPLTGPVSMIIARRSKRCL